MCVINLPRVALDSGATGIRTCDLRAQGLGGEMRTRLCSLVEHCRLYFLPGGSLHIFCWNRCCCFVVVVVVVVVCHVPVYSLGVASVPRWTTCYPTLESSFLFVRGVQADGCVVDLVLCLRWLILFYEAVCFVFGYCVQLIFILCLSFYAKTLKTINVHSYSISCWRSPQSVGRTWRCVCVDWREWRKSLRSSLWRLRRTTAALTRAVLRTRLDSQRRPTARHDCTPALVVPSRFS